MTFLAAAVARAIPQCRYDRTIFLVGHMRCGSTALSSILCSRPDVSGFGEAHIAYSGDAGALARLVLAQARRRTWRPGARYLFDKLLHNQLDEALPLGSPRFIVMAREPAPTIRSIRSMEDRLATGEHASDDISADYYESRVTRLLEMIGRMKAARTRLAVITYGQLVGGPEAVLAQVSCQIALLPALENRYWFKAVTGVPGAGDPFYARLHRSIVARPSGKREVDLRLCLPSSRVAALEALYRDFAGATTLAGG